jgi:hypothetical protein
MQRGDATRRRNARARGREARARAFNPSCRRTLGESVQLHGGRAASHAQVVARVLAGPAQVGADPTSSSLRPLGHRASLRLRLAAGKGERAGCEEERRHHLDVVLPVLGAASF